MAEYLRPGVFVEEIPSGAYPIEGVGTSCGAFIGVAERGALNKPKLITNFTQFTKHFGTYRRDSFLAHAVYGFFLNGGRRCFVNRVAGAGAMAAQAALLDRSPEHHPTILVQALNEGEWGNRITIKIHDATEDPINKFKIIVLEGSKTLEVWDNLEMILSRTSRQRPHLL